MDNLQESDDCATPTDVVLHCSVRWLSRGRVLTRFNELLAPIRLFLEEKSRHFPELDEQEWMEDFSFLVDSMVHLDKLNTSLQGKEKLLPDLAHAVFSFISKMSLFKDQLANCNYSHFPTLQKLMKQQGSPCKEPKKFVELISSLHSAFVERFHDISEKRTELLLFSRPLSVHTSAVSGEIQLELVELKEDDRLRHVDSDNALDFWRQVPLNTYPFLREAALKISSMFGSTYRCESIFSQLQHIKSKQRASLTDSHLQELLRIATTKFSPDVDGMVRRRDCRIAH